MKVIDFVGIDRQIIFPGGLGQQAIYLYNKAEDPNAFKDIKTNRKQYAHKLIECHNDWCVRAWRGQTRLRTVAILLEDNVDDMYATLKTLIDKGVRLFQLSCTKPPGGVSPADPAMDRVWALASEAGIAFAAHVDGSSADGFLATQKWKHAPAFDGWKIGDEFALDPWTLTNLHLAVQNFITTLVLGGVFDRHKNLRFGVQEFGAHWVGPLAENMDRYYAHTPFPTDIGERRLKMKPSDYIRKHVRVAPLANTSIDTVLRTCTASQRIFRTMRAEGSLWKILLRALPDKRRRRYGSSWWRTRNTSCQMIDANTLGSEPVESQIRGMARRPAISGRRQQ
jgi:predicted TIM-barrel fold metal-dependent hydrolase